jgi:hypothetical protein
MAWAKKRALYKMEGGAYNGVSFCGNEVSIDAVGAIEIMELLYELSEKYAKGSYRF